MPKYNFLECFCCEQSFTREAALLAGVSEEYASQYCSPECSEDFSAILEAGAARAEAAGIAQNEAIAHAPARSPLLNLLEAYKLKVTTESKE